MLYMDLDQLSESIQFHMQYNGLSDWIGSIHSTEAERTEPGAEVVHAGHIVATFSTVSTVSHAFVTHSAVCLLLSVLSSQTDTSHFSTPLQTTHFCALLIKVSRR